MGYKKLLIIGILSSTLYSSTFVLAEEEPSFIFKGFDFSTEKTSNNNFIDKSFDDLYNTFGNYSILTESQKEESWSEYKGKYVRWTGIVTYKGTGENDWKRVGIRHKIGTNVELKFDEDKRDMVNMIRRRDSITYTGKLSILFDRNLLFGLKDVNVEMINGVSIDELKESSDGKIDVSFEDLNKIFGNKSNLTDVQKEKLWDDYKGKHIEWHGIVNYKGAGKHDWKRIGMKHKEGTNVELRFDEDKKDTVNMIKRGDNITYTGKLAKLFGRNLLCSIVDIDIKKIGDKDIFEDEETTIPTSYSELSSITNIENKGVIEHEIKMDESMAPKVIKKDDLEIKKTSEGFLYMSFEELDDIFGKENRMTESRKDKLWEEYAGKSIRWTGQVMYRGLGRVSGLRMGIKHKDDVDVELCFHVDKKDKVLQTKVGDTIIYTGKLVTRRGYILPYKLKDCDIEYTKETKLTADPSERHGLAGDSEMSEKAEKN